MSHRLYRLEMVDLSSEHLFRSELYPVATHCRSVFSFLNKERLFTKNWWMCKVCHYLTAGAGAEVGAAPVKSPQMSCCCSAAWRGAVGITTGSPGSNKTHQRPMFINVHKMRFHTFRWGLSHWWWGNADTSWRWWKAHGRTSFGSWTTTAPISCIFLLWINYTVCLCGLGGGVHQVTYWEVHVDFYSLAFLEAEV